MAAPLQQLFDKGSLWLGHKSSATASSAESLACVTTGQTELDQALGGGWLPQRLHEIQLQQFFVGELALVASAMVRATQQQRPIFWLSPPAQPYAPALAQLGHEPTAMQQAQHIVLRPTRVADTLWSAETILHSGQAGVLLIWLEEPSAIAIRRLHLAAAASQAYVFIFSPWQPEDARSYATRLRIHLSRDSVSGHGQVQWQLLKRMGGWPLRLARQPLPKWLGK